jgi:hydroxymethylpyrimidine pyrophosphatase-like HAD family hydrolase
LLGAGTRSSEIDGDLTLAAMIARPGDADAPPQLVRVDPDEFGLSNLPCFDPAMDAVSLSLDAGDRHETAFRAVEEAVPALYAASGDPVSSERWLLLSLVRLWDLRRTGRLGSIAYERQAGRAVRRYLTGTLLASLAPPRTVTGPIVALDIDGVVEGSALGFAAPTPTSVVALRTLIAHGFRPVLVSGRSGPDVRERCRDYGLDGGVGEYGGFLYVAAGDVTDCLIGDEGRAGLSSLTTALEARDVPFDDSFATAIRAYAVNPAGTSRRGLAPELIRDLLGAMGDDVLAIEGEDQTDFVFRSIDKGLGLRLLVDRLLVGSAGSGSLVAAVGDTVADVPMLELAPQGFAPGHADRAAAGVATVVDPPFQDGLSAVVERLVGHVSGGCPQCAPAPLPPDTEQLHAVLDVASGSRRALLGRTARLVAQAQRRR